MRISKSNPHLCPELDLLSSNLNVPFKTSCSLSVLGVHTTLASIPGLVSTFSSLFLCKLFLHWIHSILKNYFCHTLQFISCVLSIFTPIKSKIFHLKVKCPSIPRSCQHPLCISNITRIRGTHSCLTS